MKKFCYLVYDLPTHYQIVYARNFIYLFENVRNFVRNCPKSIIISSENFCPKIKCPTIFEINVFLRHRSVHRKTVKGCFSTQSALGNQEISEIKMFLSTLAMLAVFKTFS